MITTVLVARIVRVTDGMIVRVLMIRRMLPGHVYRVALILNAVPHGDCSHPTQRQRNQRHEQNQRF